MLKNIRKSKLVAILIILVLLVINGSAVFAETEGMDESDATLAEKAQYAVGITDTGKVIKGSLNPNHNPFSRAIGNAGESVSKTYGGYTSYTQIITVDGVIAYCVQPEKDVPSNTDYYESVYDNDLLRTVLYYGYGGNDSGEFLNIVEGGDVNNAFMDTWMAARIANGETISNPAVLSDPAVRWLLDHATAPIGRFSVENSPQDASWVSISKLQETGWYTTSGGGEFTVEVSGTGVGVQFQDENEVYWTNQQRTTGKSFKLVAPKDKEGQAKIKIPTTAPGLAALLYVPKSEANVQNIVALGKGTDPVAPGEVIANFKKVQFNPTLEKTDADATWKADASSNGGRTGQGDATLDGAVYGIFDKDNGNAKVAEGTVKGNKIDFGNILVGNYFVREITPPKGYNLDPTEYPLENWDQGVKVHRDTKQDVIRGGFLLKKYDKELDKSEALGGADHGNNTEGTHLEGTTFVLTNRSANGVVVDGKVYAPGAEIKTLKTAWDDTLKAYTIGMGADAFPYGTYGIKETATNTGYVLSDGAEKSFKIQNHGEIVTVDASGQELIARNQVIRGDFRFNKIANDTNEAMTVAWVVTNDTTGERHVIATDRNGQYSSIRKHSADTNGNDALLAKIDAGEVIKTSDLKLTAGIWFSKGEDGSDALVNDDLGALMYGQYTVQEVRCEGNENADLKSIKLWIYEHGTEIDRGTITNNIISITTEAIDSKTQGHISMAEEDTLHGDTVSIDGLKKGQEYTVKGWAVNYEDGSAVVIDKTPVAKEKDFKAKGTDTELKMDYGFDSRTLAGKSVVYFVELYEKDGAKIAEHKELQNADQTIQFPGLQTTATDKSTEDHYGYAGEQVTIVDEVKYTNLIPGETYNIKGVLMNQQANEVLKDKDGNEVRAEKKFVPEEANGVETLEFTFDASLLAGQSVVVFEDLYYNDVKVATHADIEDKDQTVDLPKIGTTASDNETGLSESMAKEITIKDVVKYENMPIGKELTVTGKLVDQETKKPLIVADQEVTSELTFTPEESSGEVEMLFTFNATGLEGKTLVVYEKVFVGEYLLASHEDPDDEGQTIRIPKIKTTAWGKESGEKTVEAKENVTIVDTVEYVALTPGKKHTMEGQLYIKSGENKGEPLMIDGKPVTASTEFTPETPNGTVELEFTFNASALAGQTVVVFENCYQDGILVGTHSDINDVDQSVKVVAPKTDAPHTGDATKLGVILAIVLVSGAGLGIVIYRRRKAGASK